jgi:threonine aldolase
VPGIAVDAPAIRTNMVMVDTSPSGLSAGEVVQRLAERGIKASGRPPWQIRLVTHREIGDAEIDRIVEALAAITA